MSAWVDYVEAGFRVFGIHGVDKNGGCECGNPDCKALYKHPRISNWQSVPCWSEEQLDTFEQLGHFRTGFGVLCAGWLVIDVDARNGGVPSFSRLCADVPGVAEAAFVVNTGSGGGSQHHYFSLPEPLALVQHLREYPGIDFKTSGYVIGAGSLHASGADYERARGYPQDITAAPVGLLELLRKPDRHRVDLDGAAVDVSEADILDLLNYISPGQPYDEWIKVGMAIHHCTGGGGFALWDQWSAKGAKYPGASVLERHWHSFGKSAHPAGYGSVVAMARAGGYVEPVTFEYVPDEGPIQEPEPPPRPLTKQDQWLHSLMESDDAAIERVMNMEYLIDGVLPEDGFAALVGASGTGKSFVGLDMACSVATGKQWHGMDSQRGLVVYISAEGANGLRRRKRGWEQHHGIAAPLMRILPAAPLLDSNDAMLLSTVVQQAAKYTGERVKLVVVDTVNRTMSGDENSASDMANFVRGCQVIQQVNHCAVLVIHHSGHGDKERARGSSAFFAALDMEIFLKPLGADIVELSNTKNKDAESFQPVRLALSPVTLDGIVDRKGRPVATLVATKASLGQELQGAQFSLTDRQRALLDIIEIQCVEAGQRVPRADIRAQFAELFDPATDPATIRKAMHDGLAALVEKKCIRTTKTDVELMAFSRC